MAVDCAIGLVGIALLFTSDVGSDRSSEPLPTGTGLVT